MAAGAGVAHADSTDSAHGTRAYVTNYFGTVSVIDTANNQVIGSPISVGGTVSQVALTPNGRYAYIAGYGSGGNTVSVLTIGAITPGGNGGNGGYAPSGIGGAGGVGGNGGTNGTPG